MKIKLRPALDYLRRSSPRRKWAALLAAGLLATLVTWSWLGRYSLSVHRSTGIVYRMDHWTGKTVMAFPGDGTWYSIRD
jgi:hypothetical protein